MKDRSVKFRIALWLTALTALLSLFLMLAMLQLNRNVLERSAREQLLSVGRENASAIKVEDGRLSLDGNFSYYEHGVYTLVYSEGGALLAGQLPAAFPGAEDFESGRIRTVEKEGCRYLLLDMWLALNWEEGLWLRTVMEAPDGAAASGNLLAVCAAAMPLFVVMAALGSWLIIKRAFRPLEKISATAEEISQGGDLSLRIGLEGKDEFSRLAKVFDGLFARLESSFQAEKQFTADASHELRTPLAVIKGACEYGLAFDDSEEEREETLNMILRQSNRMSLLIDQLLSITRLEQGAEQIKMTELDLSRLAETVCAELFCDREISLDLLPGLIIRGNADLLARLIANLLENAFKYGEQPVCLETGEEENSVFLSVTDSGKGIDPELREKVWQRFFRADASRGENSGAGLGLSIVRQIAQMHGGSMSIEGRPGENCRFILRIPK